SLLGGRRYSPVPRDPELSRRRSPVRGRVPNPVRDNGDPRPNDPSGDGGGGVRGRGPLPRGPRDHGTQARGPGGPRTPTSRSRPRRDLGQGAPSGGPRRGRTTSF